MEASAGQIRAAADSGSYRLTSVVDWTDPGRTMFLSRPSNFKSLLLRL